MPLASTSAAAVSSRRLALITLLALVAQPLTAADWVGGSGNWSSNGNPGWNGAGVPNGIGASATVSATAFLPPLMTSPGSPSAHSRWEEGAPATALGLSTLGDSPSP